MASLSENVRKRKKRKRDLCSEVDDFMNAMDDVGVDYAGVHYEGLNNDGVDRLGVESEVNNVENNYGRSHNVKEKCSSFVKDVGNDLDRDEGIKDDFTILDSSGKEIFLSARLLIVRTSEFPMNDLLPIRDRSKCSSTYSSSSCSSSSIACFCSLPCSRAYATCFRQNINPILQKLIF